MDQTSLQTATGLSRDPEHRLATLKARRAIQSGREDTEHREMMLREIQQWFGSSFEYDNARRRRLGQPPEHWHSAKLASGDRVHPYFDEPRMKAASVAVKAGYIFA